MPEWDWNKGQLYQNHNLTQKVYRYMLKISDSDFFCYASYGSIAKQNEITRQEAIECVNWLIRNGKVSFIEAVEKVGVGDYTTKYKVNDWGFD